MKLLSRNHLAGLGVSLLLAACGGGGGGSGEGGSRDDDIVAERPVAQASASKEYVQAGETVLFTGTGSSPRNGALQYQWSLISLPQDSQATLSGADASTASLTTDLPGDYTAALVVNDGVASSNPSHATVKVLNPDPVAVINPAVFTTMQGQQVQLDGLRSLPPDGQTAAQMRYEWTLTPPAGANSTAVLDNPASAQPRFRADVLGDYSATLVVRHGDRISKTATATITVVKQYAPPVAKIRDVTDPVRGQVITLDGTDSNDPEGLPLQYYWQLEFQPYAVASPAGNPSPSRSVLANANSATTTFTPDLAGPYVATLYVYNGIARSVADTKRMIVRKPDGAPNLPPVAVITPGWNTTYEGTRNTFVTLSGFFDSYDPDGDALTYQWRYLNGPAGFDADANMLDGTTGLLKDLADHRIARFRGTHDGDYTFQLRVFDGQLWSEPVTQVYRIHNGANRVPTAMAEVMTGNNSVMVNSTVTLNGSKSTDPDNNRLVYEWKLLNRPIGSNAVLDRADTANPTFQADKPGPYIVSLVVRDLPPSGQSARSQTVKLEILAKTQNHKPSVRISSRTLYSDDQPFMVERMQDFVLNNPNTGTPYEPVPQRWRGIPMRADAFDPDGDPLTYLWALTGEPGQSQMAFPATPSGIPLICDSIGESGYNAYRTGKTFGDWAAETMSMREWTCKTMAFAPTVPGTYQLQLMVSDGIEVTAPVTIEAKAVTRDQYPSLLLERQRSNSTAPFEQEFFPLQSTQSSSIFTLPTTPTTGQQHHGVFRLTASGGDYTIVDLTVTSSDTGFQPAFDGLRNNQVIRKGQTVTFSLDIPETSYIQKQDTPGELVWSFRIAEKPDWQFQAKTTLNYRIR